MRYVNCREKHVKIENHYSYKINDICAVRKGLEPEKFSLETGDWFVHLVDSVACLSWLSIGLLCRS